MFKKFFNKTENTEMIHQRESISMGDIINSFGDIDTKNGVRDMKEVTYFVCLKVLSESVGKLSLHLKDGDGNRITKHDALKRLKYRPNQYQTPADFKIYMEYNRNHFGNAYAYMEYDKRGQLVGIHPLDPRKMTIIVDNIGITNTPELSKLLKGGKIYYQYLDGGKYYIFKSEEILHLLGGNGNLIVGRSVAETLAGTIDNNNEAQKYLNALYKRGLSSNAVLKYTGDLDTAKKNHLVSELSKFASNGDTRGFIPLPLGMDLEPIDLKLNDSQFYELRKFNSLQIASAFGIKPNHLNDYEKSSYSNSEMQNLSFYVDTLLIILTKYEEEFNYKLLTESERDKGYRFEFNIGTILRGDLKTQAESISRLTQASIYTVNESRSYMGLPSIDGGDKIMVNGSYVELEDIGVAYQNVKGGDNNANNKE